MTPLEQSPVHLDLVRDRGLTVHWPDGMQSFYPIAYLRRMSPSAEARTLREQLAKRLLACLEDGHALSEDVLLDDLEGRARPSELAPYLGAQLC